jgi:hypothetical protein
MTSATICVEAPRRRVNVTRVVLVAALLVVVIAVWVRDDRRDQEWLHGGDQVSVRARIDSANAAGLGDVLAAAGVPREPGPVGARQIFVLQVAWTGSVEAGGRYQFILLDDRVTPSRPVRGYGSWGQGKGTGPNWAGAYEALAEHYSWLAGTASRQTASGWTNDSEALDLSATPTGEGTLAYWLDEHDLPTTRPARDLALAMVLVDADGEVRWAKRVPLHHDT